MVHFIVDQQPLPQTFSQVCVDNEIFSSGRSETELNTWTYTYKPMILINIIVHNLHQHFHQPNSICVRIPTNAISFLVIVISTVNRSNRRFEPHFAPLKQVFF